MAIGKKMEKAQAENAAKAAAKVDSPEVKVTEPAVAVEIAEPPPEVPAPTPQLTPDQQAEIDRIFTDARLKAQAVLGGSPEAQLGTPSNGEDVKQERVQRDYVPGRFRADRTRVPERIYDEDEGVDRKVLLFSDYRYALVPADDFLTYTGLGYKFCKFDGGSRSGLTERGFRGTGDSIFTRELNGNCRRGDCFYMYIPIRGWEEIAAEDLSKVGDGEKRALGSFHNAAYSQGIRPFAEITPQDGSPAEKIF
jgi:hypothetical protein